jgi:DNA-directed RNA polymerase specialized sigma24 family protein
LFRSSRKAASSFLWRKRPKKDSLETPVSLLERLRQPNPDHAWERLVELYTPLLYHWAKQTGCRESDAADLVQDVLVLLVRKLPEFRYNQERNFHGWLRIVAQNCWRNLQRRMPATRFGTWNTVNDWCVAPCS